MGGNHGHRDGRGGTVGADADAGAAAAAGFLGNQRKAEKDRRGGTGNARTGRVKHG